jgi:hypothetical protein
VSDRPAAQVPSREDDKDGHPLFNGVALRAHAEGEFYGPTLEMPSLHLGRHLATVVVIGACLVVDLVLGGPMVATVGDLLDTLGS